MAMFSTLPVDEAVLELEIKDTILPVDEAAELESASNDPEVRALADSTRPFVDVALFQFQFTVLVALSIVDEAVAAAKADNVVVADPAPLPPTTRHRPVVDAVAS